ncbi:MAG: lipoprotein signal peptidase [Bacteroidales bacterium]|nr:lipoprotein signal peptidase [Bacteroidales bacterium]
MNKIQLSKGKISVIIIFLVLLVDQFTKIWVKTHMVLHESFEITPWFYICFTENNGMAYGLELFNKLFLTGFRIVAVIAFSYYLYLCIKKKYSTGFICCIALIIAGASGNIIDSVFYGKIFSSSYGQLATMFPQDGGYAPFFYGKVVDMLYFPLFKFNWPQWLPFVGGQEYLFFRPIFNVADSAITVGVILLFIFYRHHLGDSGNSEKKEVLKNK